MSIALEPELEESLDDFIRHEIAEFGLRDEREYLERLARAEQRKKIQAYYDRKLIEAIEEDVWIPMEEGWTEKMIARMELRHQNKEGKKSNESCH